VSIGFISTGLSQRFEVRIASETTVPKSPVGRGLPLWLILTGVSSTVLGIMVVTFTALWRETDSTGRS
jgi:hypothetical protein